MDTINDKSVPSKIVEASRRVCQALALEVVRRGLIDPSEMTDDQFQEEVIKCLHDEFDDGLILFVRDHTPTLLKLARNYRSEGNNYIACLLYATWAEHWLNGLISTIGERRKIQPEEATQIIRETPLRGKLSWLLTLLGLPRIAERHRNALNRITELRNGFVHYKWVGRSEEDERRDKTNLEQAVMNFEATVKYLQKYYSRAIFAGNQSRIRRII